MINLVQKFVQYFFRKPYFLHQIGATSKISAKSVCFCIKSSTYSLKKLPGWNLFNGVNTVFFDYVWKRYNSKKSYTKNEKREQNRKGFDYEKWGVATSDQAVSAWISVISSDHMIFSSQDQPLETLHPQHLIFVIPLNKIIPFTCSARQPNSSITNMCLLSLLQSPIYFYYR